jgi:hypothetical protein
LKRLTQSQIDSEAKQIHFNLVCRVGAKNAEKVLKAARKILKGEKDGQICTADSGR